MLDLPTAVVATSYAALFLLCFIAVLCYMLYDATHARGSFRNLSRFNYVWLFPLSFALFRMGTVAYLALEAFGWINEGDSDKQAQAWVAMLVLPFYAKIILFGPTIMLFRKGLASNQNLKKARSCVPLSAGGIDFIRTAFNSGLVPMTYVLAAIHSGLAGVNPALAALGKRRESGQPYISPLVLRGFNIASPIVQLVLTYLVCVWVYQRSKAFPSIIPNIMPQLIYVMAACVTLADGYILLKVITQDGLSLWCFWGVQVAMELIMTFISIYAIQHYLANVRAQIKGEIWEDILIAKWEGCGGPRPDLPSDRQILDVLNSLLHARNIPPPEGQWVEGDAAGEIHAKLAALRRDAEKKILRDDLRRGEFHLRRTSMTSPQSPSNPRSAAVDVPSRPLPYSDNSTSSITPLLIRPPLTPSWSGDIEQKPSTPLVDGPSPALHGDEPHRDFLPPSLPLSDTHHCHHAAHHASAVPFILPSTPWSLLRRFPVPSDVAEPAPLPTAHNYTSVPPTDSSSTAGFFREVRRSLESLTGRPH